MTFSDNCIRLAPMMGYTKAPFRLLVHLLSPQTQLYTEMVSINAVTHNPSPHYFAKFSQETNTVFQLGGNDPHTAVEIAKQAEQKGFSEVNINCGCPSNRVQNANFGACLMKQPEQVGEIIYEIQKHVHIPVSVKHRIGIDKVIDYEFVHHFVKVIKSSGCRHIIVHARNAWLNGLSPRLNRKIPPLRPQFVYQLKQDFPDINVCINGEIRHLDDVIRNLTDTADDNNCYSRTLDGIMIGRTAWKNPCLFAIIEHHLANVQTKLDIRDIIVRYFDTIEKNWVWLSKIWKMEMLIYPLSNIYNGNPGAKQWRNCVAQSGNLSWKDTTQQLLRISQSIQESLVRVD